MSKGAAEHQLDAFAATNFPAKLFWKNSISEIKIR